MPRRKGPPYFKLFTSIVNHRKTFEFANDPLLLGMYAAIGMMAIDRFASKTEDSFLCSGLDLQRLAGCQGVANARRRLGRLEASGGPVLSQEGAGWRLTIPNLAKKQGLDSAPVRKGDPPPHPTPHTPTPHPKSKVPVSRNETRNSPAGRAESEDPGEGASKGTTPSKAKPKKRAARCPEAPTTDQKRRLEAWGAKRPEKYTPKHMAHGWQVVYDWSHENGKTKLDWERTVKNAMTPTKNENPWGLRGFIEAGVPLTEETKRAIESMRERNRKVRESEADEQF